MQGVELRSPGAPKAGRGSFLQPVIEICGLALTGLCTAFAAKDPRATIAGRKMSGSPRFASRNGDGVSPCPRTPVTCLYKCADTHRMPQTAFPGIEGLVPPA